MIRAEPKLFVSPVKPVKAVYSHIFGMDCCGLSVGIALRLLVKVKQCSLGSPLPNSDSDPENDESCENNDNNFHIHKVGAFTPPFKIGALPC